MKILVVSPSPPITVAPSIRTHYVTRALARDHQVDMICGDFDTILGSILSTQQIHQRLQSETGSLRNLWIVPFSRKRAWLRLGFGWLRGVPMRVAFCNSSRFALEVQRRLSEENYDLIWLQFGRMAPFVRGAGLPVIVDLHDSMSLRHSNLALVERNPAMRFIHRLESAREGRHEADLIAKGYHLATVASADAQHLERAGAAPFQVSVLPNVVEWEELEKSPEDPSLQSSILFSGNMSYFPNQDALRFFHDRILPRIFAENPQASFCVLGANPPKWARRLGRDPRIKVTGFVPDLGAYIKQAKVVVVPLRCGTGVALKVVQAMALRRAVVATPHGARGLDVEHGKHLLIAEHPDDFARLVNGLLKDESMRTHLGNEGCALVRSKYALDSLSQAIRDLVRRVCGAERSPTEHEIFS